jgi:PAS domain S-box-containing protein
MSSLNPETEDQTAVVTTVERLRRELENLQRNFIGCRERMEQMEGVFTHVADAILVAAQDGRIVEANPAASAILGYSHAELLTMHPWDFVVSAAQEEILRLIQTIGPGTPVTVQRIYRCKSGEQKRMDLRLTRCTLAGRDLVIVACRDVTEQKRLEERLRRSERNLAEGQRLTKTGSWILDYKTGETDWSVETCRIFGFPDPPPSPHYREFRARVRPEDRDGVDRGLRESFETGQPRPLKYVFVLPDGVRKHIETISQPVRDESGTVVRLMGTVMDVTERQKAEDALRASELLARGQLNALTRTLDALATESEPDKFLDQVLRSIIDQLQAHSTSVWLRDTVSGLMRFEVAFENGKLVTKATASIAAVSPSLPIEEVWPWPEIFRTGKPSVLEDIRKGPPFPWRDRLLALGVVTVLTVPMLITGKVEGVIGIRFASRREFCAGETELAQAFANQAMLAMQLTRLSAQSRQAAVMAERNRMARDIHDTLAQGFTGVVVQLEAARGAAKRNENLEVAKRIEQADGLARSSLAEARRSVRALRPRSLRDGTLCMALEDLLKRMSNGLALNAEFQLEGEQRAIPEDWEEGLLRIAQESLTNTIKYAQARRFRAKLSFASDAVHLQLVDDGRGFDPHAEHDGFGLVGMRERAEQMGGDFVVRSKPGEGTEIFITLNQQIAGENQA